MQRFRRSLQRLQLADFEPQVGVPAGAGACCVALKRAPPSVCWPNPAWASPITLLASPTRSPTPSLPVPHPACAPAPRPLRSARAHASSQPPHLTNLFQLAHAPMQELLECLKELLRADRGWLPSKEGYALYVRPFAFSSGAPVPPSCLEGDALCAHGDDHPLPGGASYGALLLISQGCCSASGCALAHVCPRLPRLPPCEVQPTCSASRPPRAPPSASCSRLLGPTLPPACAPSHSSLTRCALRGAGTALLVKVKGASSPGRAVMQKGEREGQPCALDAGAAAAVLGGARGAARYPRQLLAAIPPPSAAARAGVARGRRRRQSGRQLRPDYSASGAT